VSLASVFNHVECFQRLSPPAQFQHLHCMILLCWKMHSTPTLSTIVNGLSIQLLIWRKNEIYNNSYKPH
jgi:hypothetical protein